MSQPSQQPLPLNRVRPAPAALDAMAWAAIDEDVALGCECADPSLQIEEWRQQAASAEHSNAGRKR